MLAFRESGVFTRAKIALEQENYALRGQQQARDICIKTFVFRVRRVSVDDKSFFQETNYASVSLTTWRDIRIRVILRKTKCK